MVRRPHSVPLSRVDWDDTDQGGNLAAGETAEFGRLGDQGTQCRLADAGNAGQAIGIALPGKAVADGCFNVGVEFRKFSL
jgi:hypothetical protein